MTGVRLSGRTWDCLFASCAGGLAFAVYLTTMYPGLFGLGDAAKFAFVGKVLGTPHAPGYPLYIAISHVFSYVPWGTLAHRMNVLSGILAGVTVLLTYFAARTLCLERAVAISISLALGFGRAFWSKAIYAKVYTLNAALVAAGILMLFRWGRSRRDRDLYAAIAIFALSAGNHLIVIALLPALILYTVAIDVRKAFSPRTLLVTAGLIVLGLSQYLLILVRTLQHAPYLEARASTLRELLGVMTARRWAQEIGAYGAGDVLHVRLPLMAGLVRTELTLAGLLLAIGGLIVLLRRRRPEAVLCVTGAAGVTALTAAMGSNEDQGFLLPAFFLLWLLAGAGLQFVIRTLRDTPRGVRSWMGSALALAVVAGLPSRLLVVNYAVNDHHDRTFEIRYFNALFDMLPNRSAIVTGRYTVDMMVKYKLLGEGAAAGRDIIAIPPEYEAVRDSLAHGYAVFAFDTARTALEKLGYRFEPVQLFDVPLPDYLRYIGDARTAVVAATPDAAAWLRADPRAWSGLGVSGAMLGNPGAAAPLAVIAGSRGEDPLVSNALPLNDISGTVPAGAGKPAPIPVRAVAGLDSAAVTVEGVERARVGRGAALALVDAAGRIESFSLDTAAGLRVPFDMRVLPLFTVSGAVTCRDVGNTGWQDVSALVSGGSIAVRIDNYRPFASHATFWVAGDRPATPRLSEVSGSGAPTLTTRTFNTGAAADLGQLRLAAAKDGLQSIAQLEALPVVSRVDMAVDDGGDFSAVRIAFGMVPARALVKAMVDLDNPKRATVCGEMR
jgi:hypothetical protein